MLVAPLLKFVYGSSLILRIIHVDRILRLKSVVIVILPRSVCDLLNICEEYEQNKHWQERKKERRKDERKEGKKEERIFLTSYKQKKTKQKRKSLLETMTPTCGSRNVGATQRLQRPNTTWIDSLWVCIHLALTPPPTGTMIPACSSQCRTSGVSFSLNPWHHPSINTWKTCYPFAWCQRKLPCALAFVSSCGARFPRRMSLGDLWWSCGFFFLPS